MRKNEESDVLKGGSYMNNNVIGVFDSGLGGLTAVKEIMNILPNEDIVYFGDTGRVPYGSRSPQTLYKYVTQDIRFLKQFNPKIIVVACGTASTVVLPELDSMDVVVTGVVDEAARRAVLTTKNKKIGVIATQATISSGAFERRIKAFSEEAEVYSVKCPLFVPLVENGHTESEAARLIAKEYLVPLKEKGIDTLILGCTHYPLLSKTIQDIMGDGVSLVNSGEQVALYVKRYLIENNMLNQKTSNGQYSYYVSDKTDGFENLGSLFLGREIKGMVKRIDIEKY